jgi:hypothetical protein
MDRKLMLKGVIQTYQNDFDCGYEGEDKEELRPIILELIVELSRYVNDIRYCSKVECPCSPESEIRRIIKTHGEKLDKVFFIPYGLCEVNMPKVSNELRML